MFVVLYRKIDSWFFLILDGSNQRLASFFNPTKVPIIDYIQTSWTLKFGDFGACYMPLAAPRTVQQMAFVVKHGVEPIGARIYASPIVTTTTGTSDQQFSDSSDHKLCKWFCVKRTSNLLRTHILSNKKLQQFFLSFDS